MPFLTTRTTLFILIMAIPLTPGIAQSTVTLKKAVVSSGATESSGQLLRLRATLGQSFARKSTAGSFMVNEGFWFGAPNGTVAVGQTPQPNGFRLVAEVFPNPFTTELTISWSLQEAARVSITVYDLTGVRVAVRGPRDFAAGTHLLAWSDLEKVGASLPPGMYTGVITARTQSTGKHATEVLRLLQLR